MKRVPSSPLAVALTAFLLASVFLCIRITQVTNSFSGLVDAGSRYTNSQKANVPVVQGDGYDGQFVYRLAIDPFDYKTTAHGITVDNIQRYQRIALPMLAWLSVGGQSQNVVYAIVVINVLAISLLAGFGAAFARRYGHHGAWGFLIAGYFGLAISLSRDLTEILAACFVMAGILAYEKKRFGWCAIAWSGAVLTRETALIFPAALGIATAIDLPKWRKDREVWRQLIPAVMPFVAFGGWQLWLHNHIDRWAATGASDANLTAPFGDLIPAIPRWIDDLSTHRGATLLLLVQFAILVVITIAGFMRMKSSAAPRYLKIAMFFAALLAVSLSRYVWDGPADFRMMFELYILAVLILLAGKTPRFLPWLAGIASLMTFGVRALVR